MGRGVGGQRITCAHAHREREARPPRRPGAANGKGPWKLSGVHVMLAHAILALS